MDYSCRFYKMEKSIKRMDESKCLNKLIDNLVGYLCSHTIGVMNLSYEKSAVKILDSQKKQLKNKTVELVKVL